MENPASRGSELNGFVGTSGELFWSTGVLEYWSVGKNESPILTCIGLFITALLHHSSRLPQWGKTMGAHLGGSAKPGPLSPDSLGAPFLARYSGEERKQ